VIGVVLAGFLLVRGKRFERRRSTLARSLLLCVSLLLAAAAAEVVCRFWQDMEHSRTATPIGGLGREFGRADKLRFRAPVADVPLRTDFPDPPGGREIEKAWAFRQSLTTNYSRSHAEPAGKLRDRHDLNSRGSKLGEPAQWEFYFRNSIS
jgi:hypothetical protein